MNATIRMTVKGGTTAEIPSIQGIVVLQGAEIPIA